MSPKRGAGWRDRAAARLVSGVLGRAGIRANVLVMLEHMPEVAATVGRVGGRAQSWHRFAKEGGSASAWIPVGPFDAATLRLPKAKEDFQMALHAAASVLHVGAPLWVYGANDEGARSAGRIMEPLLGPARTIASGGRCRVLEAVRQKGSSTPRGTLEEWRRTISLDFPDGPREWVSYPGVFAHGRLDGGTRALLDAVRALPLAGSRILDFACGSGVIGAFLSALEPTACVDFLDGDAIALAAAGENVPGARLIISDGFDAAAPHLYDLIVSNPPYHEGKVETPRMIERLVRGSPDRLADGGSLVLVTQRRFPLSALMKSIFEVVDVLIDAGPHRVWLGKK